MHRLLAGGERSCLFFWQSVLAVFAAVGFYTVLHTVYEIVSARLLRLHGSAELTLYGDGCDAVERTPDPRGTARAAAVFSRSV